MNVQNASTGITTFDLASGPHISTVNISSANIGFFTAVGSTLNVQNASTGITTFDLASGPNISTSKISTATIQYDIAYGNVLSNSLCIFSSVYFSTAIGWDAQLSSLEVSTITANIINVIYISSYTISTINGDFTDLTFDNGYGNILNVTTISSQTLTYDYASGKNLSTTNISTANMVFDSGVGQKLLTSSIQVSTVMGFDLPIFTMDMTNRRVGVNLGPTQQPRATMDVSGVVFATNFLTTSDRRLKSNISTLVTPLRAPNAYRYHNDETHEEDIGVMADEIEAILPECVYIRPDGYKAVSYIKLVPVCFSLIQALTERLEVLERIHSNLI